jgi:hypothetical protein
MRGRNAAFSRAAPGNMPKKRRNVGKTARLCYNRTSILRLIQRNENLSRGLCGNGVQARDIHAAGHPSDERA